MVSTSKILTVSYGTFSCTLEGFDDSFETMKAIAEYFRDLASDDRYFGAEPPTPDAEMLARIAEREIARRVDAHESEGRVVLRATNDAAAPGALAPAETEAPPAQPEAEVPETAETPAEPEIAEAPAEPEIAEAPAEPEVTEAPAAPEAPETLAESEPAEEPVETETITAEETDETETGQVEEVPAIETPWEAAWEEEAPEDAKEVLEGEADAVPEPVWDEVEEITPTPADETAADDSVAARLRRIRSVVAQSGSSYGSDDYSEDEHAQDFLNRTAAELDATLAEDDAADAIEAPEAPTGTEGAQAEAEAALEGLSTRLAETEEQTWPEEYEAPEGPETGADTAEEAFDKALSEDTLSQILADAMPQQATAPADEAGTKDEPLVPGGEDHQPEADAIDAAGPTQPLRARVVKMKRAEFEAAIAEGRIEETFEDEIGPEDIFAEFEEDEDGEEAILSPEDEAELRRELAEVEAEMRQTTADRDTTADAVHAAGAGHEETGKDTTEHDARRGAARLQDADADSDAGRLFDTADTHFEAPDSSKRRNAIHHLRAAVAATKAEHKAGRTLEPEVDDGAYRSDLASVVRPRRPRTGNGDGDGAQRPSRPPEARPAPLKLVAEQRIDTPREPVRPRRVSAAQMAAEAAPADSAQGFSEFAEQIGATTLPELLEAAAAYMADVEGRQQFSRPMLMGKLKEVEHDAFSREDGLRSFGHLLRQGKLQKVKGGRFAVTDQTEFRVKARQAG